MGLPDFESSPSNPDKQSFIDALQGIDSESMDQIEMLMGMGVGVPIYSNRTVTSIPQNHEVGRLIAGDTTRTERELLGIKLNFSHEEGKAGALILLVDGNKYVLEQLPFQNKVQSHEDILRRIYQSDLSGFLLKNEGEIEIKILDSIVQSPLVHFRQVLGNELTMSANYSTRVLLNSSTDDPKEFAPYFEKALEHGAKERREIEERRKKTNQLFSEMFNRAFGNTQSDTE